MIDFKLTFLQIIDTTINEGEIITIEEYYNYLIILCFPIIAAIAGGILFRKARAKAFILSLIIGYLFLYLIAAWMFGWSLNFEVEILPVIDPTTTVLDTLVQTL